MLALAIIGIFASFVACWINNEEFWTGLFSFALLGLIFVCAAYFGGYIVHAGWEAY